MERDGCIKIFFTPFRHFNSHAHVERDADWLIATPSTIWFQLTRSRGAWPPWDSHLMPSIYFNSHAHVERDPMTYSDQHVLADFNSHAHVERDLEKLPPDFGLKIFQLTRSRGAWLAFIPNKHTNFNHFNSHAHVERDLVTRISSQIIHLISTHTLTWSVTESSHRNKAQITISTHTLTWSVTAGHEY